MLSIPLNVCEDQENSEKMDKIVAKLNGLLDYIASEEDVSLAEAEAYVSETFRSVKQECLEERFSRIARPKEEEPVECPECEQPCVPLRIQAKHFVTDCGEICVNRWVYQCEEAHRHAPWDLKQALLDKYSRCVAEKMCRLAMLLDYREAALELSRQGIEVSHTTLQKKVMSWSETLNVCEQIDTQTLGENERWYVSCDGCHTNSPDGWKEVKVGSVYRDYPHLETSEPSSVRTESTRYVAGRLEAKHFGKELYALATQTGIYQEDIDTQEIVFIGDGAGWIWNLCEDYFPNAVEVVDYMHAKSHLYNVAKVALGETQTDEIEAWINETEPFLFDGNIPEVVKRIRALSTQEPETMKILEREANYFKKHAKRMQYKAFREKGYQIGSGVIESACNHVVGQRCKQSSMRWKETGINAMLDWICLYKNDFWDNYWYPDTIAA